MKTNTISLFCLVCICAGALTFAGCADLAAGNYPYDGGYRDPYYGSPYYGNDRYEYERERERRRLARERDRIHDERERLQDERERLERERQEAARNVPPPPPPQAQLRCPPGTRPSTHRCTKEERKRGCKDYGAGNGLGCSNF